MVQRTIARLYDSYDDAAAVVSHLESAGVPHSDISIVSRDHQTRDRSDRDLRDTATAPLAADPLLASGAISRAGVV